MRAAPRACGREACQQAPAPEQTTGAIECDAAIEKCQCLVLPGVSNLCAACVAALIKSVRHLVADGFTQNHKIRADECYDIWWRVS
jgi:hypothetical protein